MGIGLFESAGRWIIGTTQLPVGRFHSTTTQRYWDHGPSDRIQIRKWKHSRLRLIQRCTATSTETESWHRGDALPSAVRAPEAGSPSRHVAEANDGSFRLGAAAHLRE